jgi:hypothetical protein
MNKSVGANTTSSSLPEYPSPNSTYSLSGRGGAVSASQAGDTTDAPRTLAGFRRASGSGMQASFP